MRAFGIEEGVTEGGAEDALQGRVGVARVADVLEPDGWKVFVRSDGGYGGVGEDRAVAVVWSAGGLGLGS